MSSHVEFPQQGAGVPLPPSSFFPTASPDKGAERPPVDQGEAPEQKQESAPEVLSQDDAGKEIERLNQIMEGLGNRLSFGFYGDSGQLYVQMIDRKSNEVIKMLPAQDFLELRGKIKEAVGVILDEKQ